MGQGPLFRSAGPLPEGCRHCHRGGKLVLVVTGLCHRRCDYCPLSSKKKGKDLIYANEGQVEGIDGVLDEADAMRASGTGVTGGDPMCVPTRTLTFIRALRKRYGKGHHIHMYTAGDFETGWIRRLKAAGLDEIRFHPPLGTWSDLAGSRVDRNLRKAITVGMSAGMELPAIPGKAEQLEHIVEHLIQVGAGFLNLNELEFSETNRKALNKKGLTTKHGLSEAALGSEAVAISVMRRMGPAARRAGLTLHYCSSSYKDRVQLRKRMARRARNVKRPFEVLTHDSTFLLGVIEPKGGTRTSRSLIDIAWTLAEEFDVPGDLFNVDIVRKRVEIAPWVLEEIAVHIGHDCYIIEEYPTLDRLEVERTPLR